MNKKRWVRSMVLATALVTLVACNREAQSSVSPVGLWQGTLTTMTGGSGTQPFTAEIAKSASEAGGGFTGVFTVGDKVYEVTGGNRHINGKSEIFTFSIPLEELQPTLSPVEFYGMMWSGPMIENTYSGDWVFESETEYHTGEFSLERRP